MRVVPVMLCLALASCAVEGPDPEPTVTDAVRTLPAARGGQDRIGTVFPSLQPDAWFDGEGMTTDPPPTTGAVTLYRWWTNTCPFCQASLPAIEEFRRTYADRGLRVVGVYHPKPPGEEPADAVLNMARRWGFRGTIALDLDWSQLRRAWLDSGDRRATSVTFLVDRAGITRFLHPGPVFFPSDDPDDAREDADYRLLRAAIETLLNERAPEREAGTPRGGGGNDAPNAVEGSSPGL